MRISTPAARTGWRGWKFSLAATSHSPFITRLEMRTTARPCSCVCLWRVILAPVCFHFFRRDGTGWPEAWPGLWRLCGAPSPRACKYPDPRGRELFFETTGVTAREKYLESWFLGFLPH